MRLTGAILEFAFSFDWRWSRRKARSSCRYIAPIFSSTSSPLMTLFHVLRCPCIIMRRLHRKRSSYDPTLFSLVLVLSIKWLVRKTICAKHGRCRIYFRWMPHGCFLGRPRGLVWPEMSSSTISSVLQRCQLDFFLAAIKSADPA